MLNKNYYLIFNLIIALLIFNLFIVTDFLQTIFFKKFILVPDGKFIALIAVFSICLSFAANKLFFTVLMSLFFIQMVEFCHLSYFGEFINPDSIGLIFSEVGEILHSGIANFLYIYKITILPVFSFIILLVSFYLFNNRRVVSNIAFIPIVIILSVVPIKVIKNPNFSIYYPDQTMHTMRNGIYAFSGYLFKLLPAKLLSSSTKVDYIPYQVKNISPALAKNIILVIGESVNYEHMSLFGYNRETNPKLKNWLDKGLIFRKSISSSTSTKISLPLILNAVREPNNLLMLNSKSANLFNIAKQAGFKTIFISAQESVLSRGVGASFIDNMIVYDKEKDLFDQYCDDALMKILAKIDLAEKNFIVLHQRNSHSPYQNNYKHRKEFAQFDNQVDDYHQFTNNTYDNSILYNDSLLSEMLEKFSNNKESFIFFFTSDHGEMLGENNLYGHVKFDIKATKIPFLFYSNIDNINFSIEENITHYEISNLIAKSLGHEIINPNNKGNIFYIHGNNHNNVYEVLDYYEIIKNHNKVTYKYKKHTNLK
jgi:glucan phosphoethanolaminetransferase (alkaline phosphatase superfamily)